VVFSSPVFLFAFLPACLLAVLVAGVLDGLRQRMRGEPVRPVVQNLTLLAFSVGFYLYGSGQELLLMLGAVLLGWVGAILVEKTWRRTGLLIGVGGQLGLLLWFKYANFGVAQINHVRELMDAPALSWTAIGLPIGISFYVFQCVSYVFDVARGEVKARRNFLDLALFVILFPQLIAGPIVRYALIDAEIDKRQSTLPGIAQGATRFVYGLAKKVIVADACASIADAVFGLPATDLTTRTAWLGMVAYTFQIYFDFSAYSDMAIGLGRMFGFSFPENFKRPYSASSMTDFWRRWHLTLSTWFRDYVYLPLGGSRGSHAKTYRNLWIVFLLSGLWHGAAWTFVLWGALHGLLLSIERYTRTTTAETFVFGRRVLTFFLVVVTFTIFRADDLPHAGRVLSSAFWPHEAGNPLPVPVWEALTHRNLLVLALAVGSVFLPGEFVTGRWLTEATGTVVGVTRLVVMTFLALLTLTIIMSQQFSPFIYFRF
jgi:alginate O-acetyltransferase complex protein AlgI